MQKRPLFSDHGQTNIDIVNIDVDALAASENPEKFCQDVTVSKHITFLKSFLIRQFWSTQNRSLRNSIKIISQVETLSPKSSAGASD